MPRPTAAISTTVLLAALALSAPVQAEGGAFLFQWDNDKVVDTDRHYTNGMRIAYSFDEPTGRWKTTADRLAALTMFQDEGAMRAGWTLGQDMYTPEDVDRYVPDPLDRPYAGWSYLGFSAQNETDAIQDTFEVDLGMVGPAAHAGQAQNAFHRLINVSVSRGWRSQIGNEPGLLATRMTKWRMVPENLGLWDGLQFDTIAHGTAQLGNIRTAAAIGATARIGGNLQDDFGPVYGTFALPQQRPEAVTYSFFLGGEGRGIARDIFLDGNTFKKSPDVKKNPFVFEGRAGFTVHVPFDERYWITGARLTLNLVHRTREFETQDKADRYGSAQVTLNF